MSGPRKDYCRTLLAFTTKKSPNWSLVSVVMYTVEGKLHAICEWTILNRGNICQKRRVSNKEWHIRSERKEKSAIFWFSSQGKLLSGLDLHLWKGSNFCRSEHNSPKPYPWMGLNMVEKESCSKLLPKVLVITKFAWPIESIGVDSEVFILKIDILISVAFVGKRLRVIKSHLRKLYSLGSPTKRNSGGPTSPLIWKSTLLKEGFDMT